MSANDGGDPVRLSRDPIPKPHIPRCFLLIRRLPSDAPVKVGDRITASYEQDGFVLTAHDVEVVLANDLHTEIDVRPETVVTWERATAAAPQI